MVPPLAFFYFRNTLSNSNKKQRYDWIHSIPFMLVVAVLIFEFMGYKNAITFNETNMSFNEFFILQSIASKNLAVIQPLFILAYLSFVYFKYLNKNVLRNFKSTSDNIRLLIVIWFVLFSTQIAKLMKLCFGDFILNNIGDILFSLLNIFIIFLIYKLIRIISKVTENIISFKKFGKSISAK
jgi:TM2 domain-containing membrane protein YozV